MSQMDHVYITVVLFNLLVLVSFKDELMFGKKYVVNIL